MNMNVFMIMSMHTIIYDNRIRCIYLCILVYKCMHACHLLHDIYVLSEEGTGCNRWMRRWGKIFYWRKGPGGTGGCEDRAKCIIRGKD